MRGLDYAVPLSIIDLTIDRVLEEQNNLAADAEGDPEDENEERENVHILGELVDIALDTEDVEAVISLLLERPSAIDITYAEDQMAASGDQNGTTTLEGDNYHEQLTAAAVVVDGIEGGEKENEAVVVDQNEEESWGMGLKSSELQDGALKPILDASMARPRIGKGVFFLILVDMEWELVRLHKSVGARYQLQNVITNEWCEHPLDSAQYGQLGQSSARWIQFKSTAGL